MKKIILISVLILSLAFLYINAQYGLISLLGLDDKGLPVKKVTDGSLTLSSATLVGNAHTSWSSLLEKHVTPDGQVNYTGFLEEKEVLEEYLQMLAVRIPTNSWSVQELMAYYINAYNAWTVYLILENYPVKSIKDISRAWTDEFVKIGDTQISLGDLEHGILRKMNEPRIHFAINCASASCPKLLNEAYEAEKLEAQLDRVSREFINSDKRNSISPEKIELSKIFKWYKGDFQNGNLIEYINRYAKVKVTSSAKISFKEYDWHLNELSP